MICVSIYALTQRKAMQDIRRGIGRCDLLELRMDEIGDGDLGVLLGYIQNLAPGKPVLVTHRRTKPENRRRKTSARRFAHGGENEALRWQILQDAVRLGAAYVDIELEDDDPRVVELRDLIRENGYRTRLVCSHHDFQKTPSLRGLKRLFQACIDKGADVVKIVPYARNTEDNIRIFQFLSLAAGQGKDVVAFCMGEKGRLSRIAAPLFGAAFTFAALDEKSAAAPGQIAVKDMIKIREILQRKGS